MLDHISTSYCGSHPDNSQVFPFFPQMFPIFSECMFPYLFTFTVTYVSHLCSHICSHIPHFFSSSPHVLPRGLETSVQLGSTPRGVEVPAGRSARWAPRDRGLVQRPRPLFLVMGKPWNNRRLVRTICIRIHSKKLRVWNITFHNYPWLSTNYP